MRSVIKVAVSLLLFQLTYTLSPKFVLTSPLVLLIITSEVILQSVFGQQSWVFSALQGLKSTHPRRTVFAQITLLCCWGGTSKTRSESWWHPGCFLHFTRVTRRRLQRLHLTRLPLKLYETKHAAETLSLSSLLQIILLRFAVARGAPRHFQTGGQVKILRWHAKTKIHNKISCFIIFLYAC